MYLRYLAKNETEIQFETVKKLAYLLGVALEGPCCPRMWRMEADRLGYSQSSMNSQRCSRPSLAASGITSLMSLGWARGRGVD
jgi:hypothetical protein